MPPSDHDDNDDELRQRAKRAREREVLRRYAQGQADSTKRGDQLKYFEIVFKCSETSLPSTKFQVRTDAEDIEPRRIDFIHDLRALDDANDKNCPDKPPDVECDLAAEVPTEVFANPFVSRRLL